MRSLALDENDDLALASVGGGKRLTLAEGADAVAQRLRGRLGLWAGEWFLDTAIGLPFRRMLGVKNARTFTETTLRRALATCPGVAALESFAFAFDPATRAASVAFRARTTDGAVIEDDGFRLAEVTA